MVEDLRWKILIGIRQLDSGRSVVFDQNVVEKVKGESRNRLGPSLIADL